MRFEGATVSGEMCPACESTRIRRAAAFAGYSAFDCLDCDLSFGVPDTAPSAGAFDGYGWNREWTRHFDVYVQRAVYSLRAKMGIAEALVNRHIRSILDVGCGNGAYLAAAQTLGIEAEGVDVDLEHISFAQSKGLRALCCPVEGYQSQKWDFIHVKESFHLVADPGSFIRSLARLIQSNGVLYIDSTHSDGLGARIRRKLVRPPRYGQLIPRSTIAPITAAVCPAS